MQGRGRVHDRDNYVVGSPKTCDLGGVKKNKKTKAKQTLKNGKLEVPSKKRKKKRNKKKRKLVNLLRQ